MHLTHRSILDEADFASMAALARSFFSEHTHVIDLPYRFSSWALDDLANTRLWFSGADLTAWCVIQPPFWTVDIACLPALVSRLFPEILEWAESRARELRGTASARSSWYINTFSHQHDRITALEQAGYAPQTNVGANSWSKVLLLRPVSAELPEPVLADGISIHSLAGDAEVEGYVALHREVFESKNMTEMWRQRAIRSPAYRAQTDLLAVDRNGKPVGFCIGWFDPAGNDGDPNGQIEPMGVQASSRGMGIGKALLYTCMQKLKQMGAEQILVETDNDRGAALSLYTACGFRPFKDILVYRKDFPTHH